MTGIVAVLAFHATVRLGSFGGSGRLGNPVVSRDEQMLTVLTVVLVALTVLNAIVSAWATVLDARHASALARALGATPQQVTAGVSAAQVLPALPGALLGIPLGIGLFAAANGAGNDGRAARLVAGRRGAGHPGRGGRADRDPRPDRGAPPLRRHPPVRAGLTRGRPRSAVRPMARQPQEQNMSAHITARSIT